MNKLLKTERIDELYRNGYRIIQSSDTFSFGIDAVLLSGFAKVKKGERVLDMCTGTGVIPILLEAKTEGKHFDAIELQPCSADMARRSVALNGLENKITITEGDIKLCDKFFEQGSFNVVTCNPPYTPVGTGYINDMSPVAIARHEIRCNIDDVFSAAGKMLKYGGRFYMVHRFERLCDIFCTGRKYILEPKFIRFVQTTQQKPPSLVLIEFIKGGGPGLKTGLPLVVYKSDGSYSDEVNDIYNK